MLGCFYLAVSMVIDSVGLCFSLIVPHRELSRADRRVSVKTLQSLVCNINLVAWILSNVDGDLCGRCLVVAIYHTVGDFDQMHHLILYIS